MATILTVDDDPLTALRVGVELRAKGHEVIAAADGMRALSICTQQQIDLVITDIVMPLLDGWSLIRQLRSVPATALIPVIFLSELDTTHDRIKGFRLGADDYLPKPFRPEELVLRVEKALRSAEKQRQEVHRPTDPVSGVMGSLNQMGLSTLLVVNEMEKSSGVLELQREDERVRILLRQGRIVNASTERVNPPLEGAEAVYHALGWSNGRFAFAKREVTEPDAIKMQTTSILMEGARRLDEQQQSSE